MDALVFCVAVCVGIGIIALFVRIFNKGKSLTHARSEECYGVVHTIFTNPAYDNTPGNRYYNKFNNHIRHGMM
jgi:hypothetical protein